MIQSEEEEEDDIALKIFFFTSVGESQRRYVTIIYRILSIIYNLFLIKSMVYDDLKFFG